MFFLCQPCLNFKTADDPFKPDYFFNFNVDPESETDPSLPYDNPPFQTSIPPAMPGELPAHDPTPTLDPHGTLLFHKVYSTNPAAYRLGGKSLFEAMEHDPLARFRVENPHYPFAGNREWQLAQWLNSTSLTQAQIDRFLHLEYVS